MKLIANAGKLEGRSRLATWLYRVVYNASIDRLREQKRLVPVPEDGDETAVPMPSLLVDFSLSPEEMLRDAETRQALEDGDRARCRPRCAPRSSFATSRASRRHRPRRRSRSRRRT